MTSGPVFENTKHIEINLKAGSVIHARWNTVTRTGGGRSLYFSSKHFLHWEEIRKFLKPVGAEGSKEPKTYEALVLGGKFLVSIWLKIC